MAGAAWWSRTSRRALHRTSAAVISPDCLPVSNRPCPRQARLRQDSCCGKGHLPLLPIKDTLFSIRLSRCGGASPLAASAQSRSFVCFMGVFCSAADCRFPTDRPQLLQCFRRGSFHTRNGCPNIASVNCSAVIVGAVHPASLVNSGEHLCHFLCSWLPCSRNGSRDALLISL